MGKVSQKSKKKRRQSAIKSIILRPIFDERREQIAQNNKLSMLGIDNLKPKAKNAFLYPEDPEAVFFQREPEAVLDVRVEKHPHAALEYEQKRKDNKFKNKYFGKQEFARLAEDEMEQELLDGFKKLEVGDDDRGEERDDDMNELVDAMGRLQIHEKVKASRCK